MRTNSYERSALHFLLSLGVYGLMVPTSFEASVTVLHWVGFPEKDSVSDRSYQLTLLATGFLSFDPVHIPAYVNETVQHLFSPSGASTVSPCRYAVVERNGFFRMLSIDSTLMAT